MGGVNPAVDNEIGQLRSGAETLGVSLEDAQAQDMIRLLDLLEKWNRAYNLTAVRERQAMLSRHLLDSLSLVPLVKAEAVLDLGAGGGFPGLVLALQSRQRSVTLIDSNLKKARFLLQCRLELGLDNITVVNERVESYQPTRPFAQITSRAFASLAETVDLAGHLLTDCGELLAMKGPEADREARELPPPWQVVEDRRVDVPGTEAERRLLRVSRPGPK